MRLSKCVPIFKKDTPQDLQTVPVTLGKRKYLDYYFDDAYCWNCFTVVELHKTKQCPNCDFVNYFLEEGWACHKCNLGVIKHIEEDIVCF